VYWNGVIRGTVEQQKLYGNGVIGGTVEQQKLCGNGVKRWTVEQQKLYGNGVIRGTVEQQKFKECEQRKNYVLNNFNISYSILILLLLFHQGWWVMGYMKSQILERMCMNILAALSGYSKHGRHNGLNEILILKLLG